MAMKMSNPLLVDQKQQSLRLEKGYMNRKQKLLESIKIKRKMSEGYTLSSIRNYQELPSDEIQKIRAEYSLEKL